MASDKLRFMNEATARPEHNDSGADKQRKRRANLYDAVAGRVNSHGFIPAHPYASKYRDTASSSNRPIPPEEVLFRRKGMPIRYEETDRYFAHRDLPPEQPLPSSELLESIHAYTADFYDLAAGGENGRVNSYTMNGNSLMFMGVLLEEMAREALGETGDMVLVEGDTLSTDEESSSRVKRRRKNRRKRANSGFSSYASSGEDLESVVKRKRRVKRPRLSRRASTTDLDTEVEERRREV